MGLECPPEDKIGLFRHIEVHGNYVGVLRPIKTEDSEIEIPDTADSQESMENAKARVAVVGDDVESNLNAGDAVYVSIFMQKPHQVVKQTDRHGEEWHMFIIDSGMVVATAHEEKKKDIENILDKGSVS